MIIATDVPAHVKLDKEESVSLCAKTPCAVALPLGDHLLKFSGLADEGRSSSVAFKVRNDTEVLNHALGQERENVVQYAGAGAIVVGGLVTLFGTWGFVTNNALQDGETASQRSAHEAAASRAETVALVGLLGAVVGGHRARHQPQRRAAGIHHAMVAGDRHEQVDAGLELREKSLLNEQYHPLVPGVIGQVHVRRVAAALSQDSKDAVQVVVVHLHLRLAKWFTID